MTDRAGAIRLVNHQTEALFGYPQQELLGQSVQALIPEWQDVAYQRLWGGDGAAADQPWRAANDDVAGFVPVIGRRRDGHQFPVEIRIARLEQDGEHLMIATVRAARDEQRAQEADQQQLRRVLAVTDTALAHLDLDVLLPELLARVRDVMDADFVSIWLLEADGRQLTLWPESHQAPDGPAAAPIPVGVGLAGRIAASRRPLVVDDVSRFPLARPQMRKTTQSAMGVPLLTDERLLGVLCVGAAQTQRFSQPDVALLEQTAARISTAIERARLFEAEQTARYEAERERARWLAAMESAPEFVITCDADLRMTYVNPAYARLRGSLADPEAPAEERPARHGLFLPDGATLFPVEQLPLTRALREGRPVHGVQMMLRTPQGEERLVEWQAAPKSTAQGETLGAVAIGHDVTERQRAEEARRASEARFRAAFESAAIGVAVVDLTGRPQEVNDYIAGMMGYTQDEFSRLTLSDFTHPDDIAANMALIRRARDGELDRYQLEKRYVHKDGHVVWGLTSAAVVRDQAGQPAYFVVHVEDITQRKQLEREREEALVASEAWFHTLTNTAPVLVWVSGPDGLVTFVNLPWLQFTGRTLEQELGDGWAEGVHPDDHDRCLQTYRAAFDARQPFTMEYRLRRADGAYRWLVDTGVPRFAPDGAFLGYIGSVIDISDRLQLEQEREEARAAAVAEREANAQMDAFLGMVSHELKQPLTVMSTSIQLAQRRLGRLAAATAALALPELEAQIAPLQKELTRTEQQVDYQNGLINDLLDAARVRTGKFATYPEPENMLSLVRSAVEEQRRLTTERVIRLDLPEVESIPILADARRIKQVVTNYLTNALKYSPGERPVEVGVTADDTQARVWVRDQGPGLAPDQQQRIFERFYRAPGIEIQSGVGVGLGLGLYICRTIIEQHGGQVGVESAPGQGCAFWFTLPLTDTSAPTPQSL